MKRHFYPLISLTVLLTPVAFSAQPIVTSDGPNTSSSSSSQHPNIVTTDGPAVLPYAWPPKIITTDGPSVLPYGLPGSIATSDGPNQTTHQPSANSHGLEISDGPGTTRELSPKTQSSEQHQKVVILDAPEPILPHKHSSKKVIAKHKHPLPEPEASALAPAIPVQSPSDPPPENSHGTATGRILASIIGLSVLAYGSLWAYRRWNSPE